MVPALFPDDEKEGIIGQVIIDWLKYSWTDSHLNWTRVLVGNFFWAWRSRPNFYFLSLLLQVRDEANKAGVPPARESIWQYFVNKCANNLHIVLAMSPVGETLRTRCRNFPGLVNNCSIDWFTAWPQQALHAVASVFLGENVS